MRFNSKLIILLAGTIFINCSCSSSKSSATSKQYNGSGKSGGFPRVPKKVVPGGTGDNWRYLGKTSNGSFVIEIDDSSINKSSGQVYRFTDRKMVVNQANFNYQNFPPYKYNISSWLIDCSSSSYKINSTAIYDELGKSIKNYDFDSNFIKISKDSIMFKEYEYVCLNKYRNIGY